MNRGEERAATKFRGDLRPRDYNESSMTSAAAQLLQGQWSLWQSKYHSFEPIIDDSSTKHPPLKLACSKADRNMLTAVARLVMDLDKRTTPPSDSLLHRVVVATEDAAAKEKGGRQQQQQKQQQHMDALRLAKDVLKSSIENLLSNSMAMVDFVTVLDDIVTFVNDALDVVSLNGKQRHWEIDRERWKLCVVRRGR